MNTVSCKKMASRINALNEPAEINVPPIGYPATFTTNEDTKFDAKLTGADLNAKDSLNFIIVTDGTKGHAEVFGLNTGDFYYQPYANETGTDTFTFKVNDGLADSPEAIVVVTIVAVNDAPEFTAIPDRLFDGGDGPLVQGTEYTFGGAATDVDDNAVTYACVYESMGLDASDPNYAAADNDCTSLASLTTSNSVVIRSTAVFSDGVLTWTPTSEQRGTFKFTIAATETDGSPTNLTGTEEFYVTVRANYVTDPNSDSTDEIVIALDASYSTDFQSESQNDFGVAPRLDGTANDDVTTNWFDLMLALNGDMSTFTTESPWIGDGTYSNPYALDFDGANDHVNFDDTDLVNFEGGDFALEAWINKDATASKNILFGKDIDDDRQFYLVLDHDGDNTNIMKFLYSGDSGDVYLVSSANLFSNNEWTHLLTQRSGDSFEIYVNGKLKNSGTTAGTHGTMLDSAAPLYIGKRDLAGFSNYYNGRIGRAAIYNDSLTAAQVNQNFNVTANRFRETPIDDIYTDNLILHLDAASAKNGVSFPGLPLDDCSDLYSSWFDLSGTGATGTLMYFINPECATLGWNGTGVAADPYRLTFATATPEAVDLGSSTTLNSESALSIEAWIRPSDFTGYNSIVSRWATVVADRAYYLGLYGGNGQLAFYASDGVAATNPYRRTAAQLTLNVWSHVVGTYDAGVIKFYVNGAIWADDGLGGVIPTGINPTPSNKVSVGYDIVKATNSFGGDIAIVRMFNSVLTLEQAKQNCHAQKDRFDGGTCADP